MPTLINADSLDTSPPEWLVDTFLPRVGLGFLHGPSYSGKSLVADNELALAVANGTPFFGHPVIQGNVVVALGEGLYDAGVRLAGRLGRQQRDNEAMLASIADEAGRETARAALPPYTSERLFIQTEPFSLPVNHDGSPNESLRRALSQLRIIPDLALIILDALSDFSGGLSISNDASASRIILGLKMLVRELDCVVLVVSHNNADGRRMTGAPRLFNASDFVMGVTPDDTGPGEPKSATIACEKSKYGPEFEPMGYQIEPLAWITDAGEVITSASVRHQGDAQADGATVLRLPGDARSRPRALPDVTSAMRVRKRNGIAPGPVTPAMRVITRRVASGEITARQALEELATLRAATREQAPEQEETVPVPSPAAGQRQEAPPERGTQPAGPLAAALRKATTDLGLDPEPLPPPEALFLAIPEPLSGAASPSPA